MIAMCPSSFVRHSLRVINFLACIRSSGHIFSPIIMKLGRNVCLDEISNKLENGSCQVENYLDEISNKLENGSCQVKN